jgi:hypothetical protein
LFGPTNHTKRIFNPGTRASEGFPSAHHPLEVVMTEEDLNQFELLDEFSITELEQQLEFEAWCDIICIDI